MRETDVLIGGGGFAGSLAAAMLGRAGIDAIVVDPHPVYPPDFRCEKLDGAQMRTFQLTGVADAMIRASTPDPETWVARYGRVVERRPGDQRGILYDRLVNTLRSQIPATTPFVHAKVANIATGPERQTVTLSSGEDISARLVVLATGLNHGVRQKLGVDREILSPCHSISIGFDVEPTGGRAFPFDSLTYYAERPSDRMAYITLFPIGNTLRANLFGYRDIKDPWIARFRETPQESLLAMWPGLRGVMGGFAISGKVEVRPVDLCVSQGHRREGVVLVGDAFSTSCPAAGTGARKALVDVERLCNVHLPAWLASPGMGTGKIAAFYDDPVKVACDAFCLAKAFDLRDFSIDTSPRRELERRARFVLQAGRGLLRRATTGRPARPVEAGESVNAVNHAR